jgi:dihydroflavonol-4-reductase
VKVAVTGGSGVVGRAVVSHLIEAGHDVAALARSAGSSAILGGLGAEVVDGDIFDERALNRLTDDRAWVFHIAGVNEMCLRDSRHMWDINVDGSLAVLEAAQRNGVRRMVHTSSAVTIGEEHGTVGTEDSKHRGYFLSEYERSKTVAERLVFERAGEVDVVSVNPSSVQGPGRSTGTGALLLAIARGNVPFLVDATISLVDITDCARGHLLAAELGEPGQRYILSGPVVTVREGVRKINQRLGRRRRPWFIRPEVVASVAPIAGRISQMLGRQSILCPESALVLLGGHRYDGSKASRDLGLEYAALDDTLARTLEWFRQTELV